MIVDNEETCSADDVGNRPLGRCSAFYYGVGHMLNDITSSCWFTYILLFLTEIGLSPRDAATVMLSGQVADGVTTIFVGELIDRFGRFKLWHAGGSILVAISFSSVFGDCLSCEVLGIDSPTLRTIGYSIFAAIFNVGWAATQVSHMSMVNCITLNSTSRVALTSCRNAFTMVANLSLYTIAFVVFKVINGTTSDGIEKQYRWIAYFSIFVGSCFVCLFLFGTKEPRLKQHSPRRSHQRVLWNYWFQKILYYQVALVYVLTRLATNVSQALLAFYVIDDLHMTQSSKASVTAVGMESFLVGRDLNGCAFVYGSLSFLDKISCGIALYTLELYHGSDRGFKSCYVFGHCLSISRYGLGLVPSLCALLGVLVTYTMKLDPANSKQLLEPLLG
ncbi:major facilitator superfamily domain-containing protein 12 isoform X2 [Amborella trichopoda]|uniref:major facilitator superfamily domain-containing protein 12 isoform X2 n=1 Tax=Amborella trichopoda TaxID=13333 RepID=UPI0009C0099B|nr:major facilitator superfamily domain-containing protein 12 isoform X2 [Amborella trichopoda]|eukprot:XP_020521950.1 major facilitator superfamily domain-containing protein 12 isoform X2 [Amborella trichopoda]